MVGSTSRRDMERVMRSALIVDGATVMPCCSMESALGWAILRTLPLELTPAKRLGA
jgi:hypothetical protein